MFTGKISLTGVKPTGTPHLGNLLGAFMPVVNMAEQAAKTYVFVADLHALNAVKERDAIRENTYAVASTYLALGINMDKTVLFRQSDIPEVCYLTEILIEDAGVNMGLYTYPILMAADILLYNSDVVPVGQDQKQHVEFARDIAGSFNYLYGDILNVPEAIIPEGAASIPGFDGRKMSKSYNNTIPIFSSEKDLRKLVMKIVTDSKLPEEPKEPEESTIFQIYKGIATPEKTREFAKKFLCGGMGYGEAKQILFEELNSYLSGPREKYEYLMAHKEEVDGILSDGAVKARQEARKTLEKVLDAVL